MIIIPAIDLKEGKCVRLRQGRMDSSTVYNEDPAAQARTWEDLGASRIHVVDLDGSIAGRPANLRSIEDIVANVRVPIQVGGGIRDDDTIKHYLAVGVNSVILGTVSARQPERVRDYITMFPGSVAIAIDARSGVLSVQGWEETTDLKATRLAEEFSQSPPIAFIYTDIDRDGMMTGPNIAATKQFAACTDVPVILSGGVSTLDDVRKALPLARDGVTGVIIGRALYEGTIDLKDAIALAER